MTNEDEVINTLLGNDMRFSYVHEMSKMGGLVSASDAKYYFDAFKTKKRTVSKNIKEVWSPRDIDSKDIKKSFIARCHVEPSAGGFLRFSLPKNGKTSSWLDERLMADFITTALDSAREEAYEVGIKDFVNWCSKIYPWSDPFVSKLEDLSVDYLVGKKMKKDAKGGDK